MRILIDTNVVLDFLGARENFESAEKIWKLCAAGRIEGFVSASAITDIFFILQKLIDREMVYSTLEMFLSAINIGDVTTREILEALKKRNKDFEDTVQSECAISYSADYIITRDVKGFINSTVKAISPDAFLSILQSY